jgi:hypothetical protein
LTKRQKNHQRIITIPAKKTSHNTPSTQLQKKNLPEKIVAINTIVTIQRNSIP